MARISPQEAAEKLARRAAGATADYAAGINRVTGESPGQRAAAKSAKWRAGLQQAFADNKWENRVASVSLQDWKNAAITKGQQRYAQGVQEGAAKYQQFAQEFFPFQQAIVDRANAMDDQTPEARIQKAVFIMQETAKYRRS